MKKISIIVPVYNCEKTIIRCINSVINQKYKNYELIIINDGSTDNTDSIIKQFLASNPNNKIKYFSVKNGGVSSARNIGLKNVTGDVVTFLDADDYYSSGFLDNINSNFNDNDIILYGYKTIFDKNESILTCGKGIKIKNEKDKLYRKLSSKSLFNPICNKVYSKKIIENVKFDENIELGEDLKFFTECLYYAKNVEYIDETFYNYEINLSGLGFNRKKNMFLKKIDSLEWLIKIYKDNDFCIKDISHIFVKNYICDFMALSEKNNLSNSTIKELQEKITKNFDFFEYSYSFQYKFLLKIFLSNCYIMIKLLTKFINFVDKINKYRKFKIKK